MTNLAWSPDGTLLASSSGEFGSRDDTVRLWRADGGLAAVLTGHTGPVASLSWSPDGQTLATGSLDGTIRVWQSDGTLASVLNGHAGQVLAVAWAPDGAILASGSIVTFPSPTIQWWNGAGQIVRTLSTESSGGKFFNLVWSPDGRYLVGGATDYKEWDSNGQMVGTAGCAQCTPAWGMAWSPDSRWWAVGNESGQVEIYDTQGKRVAAMQNSSGNVDALAWSPDGRTLAGGDGVAFWQADGTLLAQHQSFGRVHSLAWSPDGQLLASASEDGVVRLWSADGRSMALLPGDGGPDTTVAWSPRGQTLAAGSQDGSVRLWTLTVPAGQLFQSVTEDVYECPLTVLGPERPSDPTSHSFGAYWYKSADGLLWASPGAHLHVGGNKVGWSRPAGAELQVSGRRLDAASTPMTADLPCCYPDHFQASGLYFPTEGCWEVTARAGASELKFVVRVGPAA